MEALLPHQSLVLSLSLSFYASFTLFFAYLVFWVNKDFCFFCFYLGGGGGPQKLFGKASTVKVEDVKEIAQEEAQQPWIKLGLGIGASCSSSCDEAQNPVTIAIGSSSSCSCEDAQRHEKPVLLTPTQLHELQQQALIYKHLSASLPVPLHLVIPIWKSVASCFGPAIYDRYPSCESL